ncbi:hypothetical protein BS47DRAFT_1364610 [Hydnum rufescens UP504]|uniref:Uncharacterized protein n=1 Tax=Hydnum rufescens UP504 TaxID=1448309 RepID=A0A9P6DT87_9AGAM|nr:hypothetical protein BS47DRAFT_1364610 [Hydnum rufescens UP504]
MAREEFLLLAEYKASTFSGEFSGKVLLAITIEDEVIEEPYVLRVLPSCVNPQGPTGSKKHVQSRRTRHSHCPKLKRSSFHSKGQHQHSNEALQSGPFASKFGWRRSPYFIATLIPDRLNPFDKGKLLRKLIERLHTLPSRRAFMVSLTTEEHRRTAEDWRLQPGRRPSPPGPNGPIPLLKTVLLHADNLRPASHVQHITQQQMTKISPNVFASSYHGIGWRCPQPVTSANLNPDWLGMFAEAASAPGDAGCKAHSSTSCNQAELVRAMPEYAPMCGPRTLHRTTAWPNAQKKEARSESRRTEAESRTHTMRQLVYRQAEEEKRTKQGQPKGGKEEMPSASSCEGNPWGAKPSEKTKCKEELMLLQDHAWVSR